MNMMNNPWSWTLLYIAFGIVTIAAYAVAYRVISKGGR